MINQAWLKTFCTLAEVGHFTLTAQKLYMTQSGVSQHIQKLEQQLDTPLLIREGKSFELTEAGNLLYQKGLLALKTLNDLEHSVKRDNPYEGRICIASPGSVGLRLYNYLLTLQQQHPQLIIDYTFASNGGIEQGLLDRTYDIALMTELSKVKNIICQKLASEPLVLVTPANITEPSWKNLTSLGFISHPDSHHHAQLLLSENYPKFEHTQQFIHKGFSNQISLICEPVSLGLGFTVLPLHAAQSYSQQNKINIHSLKNPVYETIYLAFNRNSLSSARAHYLQEEIERFMLLS